MGISRAHSQVPSLRLRPYPFREVIVKSHRVSLASSVQGPFQVVGVLLCHTHEESEGIRARCRSDLERSDGAQLYTAQWVCRHSASQVVRRRVDDSDGYDLSLERY